MPFAITLRFDPASSSRIEDLWHVLAAEDIDTDRHDLGYAAHITLAIYPDGTAEDRLHTACTHVAESWRHHAVTLGGDRRFPRCFFDLVGLSRGHA